MKKIFSAASLASLFIITACGDIKTVVQAPHVPLKPEYKKVIAKQGEDPGYAQQWNMKKIDAEKAWQISQGGTRRLRVAILSSGVDYNHEDLQANLYLNLKEFTEAQKVAPKLTQLIGKKDSAGNLYVDGVLGRDVVDSDGFPYDNLGDGTAAAGIIGAVHDNGVGIKGIVNEVTIIPVRYIDASGSASVERLIEAFKYLNNVDPKPDVILVQAANVNFSKTAGIGTGNFTPDGFAGFSEESSLAQELAKWAKADVPIVVSAGNRSSDVGASKGVIAAFAKYPNAFLVTSVDEKDNKPMLANWGMRQVLTTAPGVNIYTTLPGNNYGIRKGTFLAAAHVAGTITLALKMYHGKLSTDDIRKKLLDPKGSDAVEQLAPFTMGSNRLNAGKFLGLISTGQ